jgi:prevent-host-death family protein
MDYVKYRTMESRISATELARRLGDVLGRIRYRGESFTVVRNGTPVARLTPLQEPHPASLGDVLAAWKEAIGTDPSLADDLERAGAADRPPGNPWDW